MKHCKTRSMRTGDCRVKPRADWAGLHRPLGRGESDKKAKQDSFKNWTTTLTVVPVEDAFGKDPYELRIAGLTDGGKTWKLVSVAVSPRDKAAGVTASSRASSGLVLVTLQCPQSRDVKWTVQFDGTSP